MSPLQLIDFLQHSHSGGQIIDPLEEAKYHVQELKSMEYPGESIRQKLVFLIEQLELALCMISIVDIRRTCSQHVCFGKIHLPTFISKYERKGFLLFPLNASQPIQKLSSAISMDTGLTKQTLKYLKARSAKLNKHEKIGVLLKDEVYVSSPDRMVGYVEWRKEIQPKHC